MDSPHFYGNDLIEPYADDKVLTHSATLSADMADNASYLHQVHDTVQMPAVNSAMAKAAQASIIPAAKHPETWSAMHGSAVGNDTLRYGTWTVATCLYAHSSQQLC